MRVLHTACSGPAAPDAAKPKDDSGLKPFEEVSKGYEKVVSTADGKGSCTRSEKGEGRRAAGRVAARLVGAEALRGDDDRDGRDIRWVAVGQLYVYWKRLDNRLLLIAREADNRSTGDAESKAGVKQIFTDRVLLDVPIVAMGPGGQPVIDLKKMLAGRVKEMFAPGAAVGGFLGGRGCRVRTRDLPDSRARRRSPKTLRSATRCRPLVAGCRSFIIRSAAFRTARVHASRGG